MKAIGSVGNDSVLYLAWEALAMDPLDWIFIIFSYDCYVHDTVVFVGPRSISLLAWESLLFFL